MKNLNKKISNFTDEEIKEFNKIKNELMNNSEVCTEYNINPNNAEQLNKAAYNLMFGRTPPKAYPRTLSP